MKVVFDTNVYLAATREGYAWEQLMRSAPNGPYRAFISPEIILEVRRKLESKFGWSPAASAEFVDTLLLYAKLVQPAQRVSGVLQDTDDHIILECALQAKAQAIVTADRGLLRLKEFQGIAIMHPTMLQYLQ